MNKIKQVKEFDGISKSCSLLAFKYFNRHLHSWNVDTLIEHDNILTSRSTCCLSKMFSILCQSTSGHIQRRTDNRRIRQYYGHVFCCVSDFTKASYSWSSMSPVAMARWRWKAAYLCTFPNCHPADSSQPGERGRAAERRGRHKSYVLYKKKYYPCQGKVGCPKMNDNRLIKNNGRLNDK